MLNDLPSHVRRLVERRIRNLKTDPRPSGCKKLITGIYRVRQGSYRVLYRIDDGQRLITVVSIEDRKEVYR